MFVSSQRHRRNPRHYFFNDKPLPMGSIPERCVSGPMTVETALQGSGAYKLFFDMSQEKNICSPSAVCVMVTPSQKRLLELLKGPEAADFAQSLRKVHYNGTYGVPVDEYCPTSSRYTHLLLDAIQDMADRHENSQLKKATL